MSSLVLITVTGLGLGALYALVASGLALIYGLMGVLNLAHGAFFTIGAYATWTVTELLGDGAIGLSAFAAALAAGAATGALVGVALELTVIRRLYGRQLEQALATLGVSFALVALVRGVAGPDPRRVALPPVIDDTTTVLGAAVPNDRLLLIAIAGLLLAALAGFLRATRHGLVIRAAVENRRMVGALGIDVAPSFTLVFALGGLAAGLAGGLGAAYFGAVGPEQGIQLLVTAFIVVVIGGVGSVPGAAVAALLVALVQQYLNFYAAQGVGDFSIAALLAAVLLVRPAGLAGRLGWASPHAAGRRA